MKRRFIIAGVVALLSAGAGYLLFGRGPAASTQTPDGGEESIPFITRATTQPDQVLDGGEFLKLPPGAQTYTRIYDRVTGEPKYIFRADSWRPLSDNEFNVARPEIQVHTPSGQITYVHADEGQIVLAQSGRRSAEPKRGWLRGNVRILLDRTTKAWRAAHPDEAAVEQHPDQVIQIFLADIEFDLDRARLESAGEIRVQSDEADVLGRGLTIAYNQVDNRIDFLTIREGRKMELRRGGSMVEFGLPGVERESSDRSTAARAAEAPDMSFAKARAMEPAKVDETMAGVTDQIRAQKRPPARVEMVPASGPAAVAGTDDLAQSAAAMSDEARLAVQRTTTRPVPAPASQPDLDLMAAKRRERVDTYSAVFTGEVRVEQRQGMRLPGRLTCDQLEIIFDFGSRQRKGSLLGRQEPLAGATTRPQREKTPPAATPPGVKDETRLVLTWNGPLEMRPLQLAPEEKSGERFDCIASGNAVRVTDGRGEATCTQLVYRNDRKQVWLAGSDAAPVRIVSHGESARGEDQPVRVIAGTVVGRELFLDRRRGIARVDGPGEMSRGASGETVSTDAFSAALGGGGAIHWTRGVELELRQVGEKRTDPATGQSRTTFREYISRAWFHGGVRVERGDERIHGEDVAATFHPPVRAGQANGPLRHLDLRGRVLLERRPDRIRARAMTVNFALTPDGRDSYPQLAHAEGKVRAVQDRRRISAAALDAVLALVTPPPPLDSPPGTPPRPQLGMSELHARGNVSVHDPDQNFRLSAEELDAFLKNGRQMQRATVVGEEGERFAEVDYGDYKIVGHRIESDLEKQTVDVPGPGRAYFTTDRDFGGGELRESETAKVRWINSMKLRGLENNAIFDGAVRADTRSHTMRCDRLSVVLGQLPPRNRPVEKPSARRIAGFTPPPALMGSKLLLAQTALEAGRRTWSAFAPALPAASPKPQARQTVAISAPAELLVRRQPVRVIASGKSEAIRSIRQGRDDGRLLSRVTLRGEQIVVDLRRQTMNIPGAGALLIEDYAFGADRSRRNRRDSAVSMFDAGDAGPSQTAFRWANGMSYFVDQSLVKFDRQVSMRHVSGDQLILKDELAKSMNFNPLQVKLPPGRKADLSCDDLMVQFLQSQAQQQSPTPDVRGADLRQLVAGGSVHLQEGTKSLMGERITFSRDSDRVVVEGSEQFEARIFDQDESSQRFNMWRGPLLVWDRSANRVEAPQAQVISRGR